jgi:Ca2+-transporting ATPase
MPRELGLTSDQVLTQRVQFGFNSLPESKPPSPLVIFINQFKSLMVGLLLVVTVISLLLGELADSVVILLIVLLNAGIGFFQEIKAHREMKALKALVVPTTQVIRDGREISIPAKELVPGDVVVLREGDRIPADGVILEAKNATVNEAALTGESVPVEKQIGSEAFLSTVLLSGRALVKITATGVTTKFGTIAKTLETIQSEKTPLEIKIADFSKKLSAVIAAVIAVMIVLGLFQGRAFFEVFFSAIALAVAAIPEGLPAVLTIALAIGVQRLARRGAIVKKLAVTEALGSVDVICTDKTGTLTKNEMTVQKIWLSGEADITVSGVGYRLDGRIEADLDTSPQLKELLKIAALCNSSSLVIEEEKTKTYKVLGDTTEGALLVLVEKSGMDYASLRHEYPLVEEFPFDATRKVMSVVTSETVMVKGAPDRILEMTVGLAGDEEKQILDKVSAWGSAGYRVLAFAAKPTPQHTLTEKAAEQDLTFLGLAAIFDPPRPEVKQAIANCHAAGISVVILTGDAVETARAVAADIGLSHDYEVINGMQLTALDDHLLKSKLEQRVIFARVSPNDKLRIVSVLQSMGKVVAVTGDGVNDALALKKAQIGVAMGKTGTDVAKEAADLIITDDNFSTIVSAVREGRVIFTNLLSAIRYLLACNFGEVLVVLLALVAGLPLPLSPLAILWMNVVTDGLPALALAIDERGDGVLTKSWKHSFGHMQLVSAKDAGRLGILALLLAMITLGLYRLIMPIDLSTARLVAFSALVLLELLLSFFIRGKDQKYNNNKLLLFSVGLALLLQLIIIAVPSLRARFV